MPKYEVGQELRVFPLRNNLYGRTPEGGYKGEVIKIARKYMTVAFDLYSSGPLHEELFELEGGYSKRTSYGSTWRVETLQEVEESARRALAWRMLNEIGLVERWDHPVRVTLEQLEVLADVIQNHPAFNTSEES